MFNVWYRILYCLHVATVVILVCSNSLDRFSSCAEKKGNIFLKYEHIIFLIYVLALPIDASNFSGCFFLLISIKINKSWKQSKQNGHLIAAAAAHLAATKWILIQYTFCNEYFGHKVKYHYMSTVIYHCFITEFCLSDSPNSTLSHFMNEYYVILNATIGTPQPSLFCMAVDYVDSLVAVQFYRCKRMYVYAYVKYILLQNDDE